MSCGPSGFLDHDEDRPPKIPGLPVASHRDGRVAEPQLATDRLDLLFRRDVARDRVGCVPGAGSMSTNTRKVTTTTTGMVARSRFPMKRSMAYDFVLYRYLKSISPLHSPSRSSMFPIDPSCNHTCDALHTGTMYAFS